MGSKHRINKNAIGNLMGKAAFLTIPKNYSKLPILISWEGTIWGWVKTIKTKVLLGNTKYTLVGRAVSTVETKVLVLIFLSKVQWVAATPISTDCIGIVPLKGCRIAEQGEHLTYANQSSRPL